MLSHNPSFCGDFSNIMLANATPIAKKCLINAFQGCENNKMLLKDSIARNSMIVKFKNKLSSKCVHNFVLHYNGKQFMLDLRKTQVKKVSEKGKHVFQALDTTFRHYDGRKSVT